MVLKFYLSYGISQFSHMTTEEMLDQFLCESHTISELQKVTGLFFSKQLLKYYHLHVRYCKQTLPRKKPIFNVVPELMLLYYLQQWEVQECFSEDLYAL